MKYTIFSGCLIQTRFPEYEASTHLILDSLGLKHEFIDNFSCCGSQIVESIDEDKLYLINARNFALAEQKAVDMIVTLCGSCTYILKKSQIALGRTELKTKINKKLSQIGLSLNRATPIQHLAEFLNQPKIFQRLKSKLKKTLSLKLALQNPCMLYRPQRISHINGNEKPFLSNLLTACGSEVVSYEYQDQCCEGTMLAFKQGVGEPLVKTRYASVQQLGVDLFVVGCPNCQLVYSIFPSILQSQMVPSIFFPQLLGLSMGYSFDEVGLEYNIAKEVIQNVLELKSNH